MLIDKIWNQLCLNAFTMNSEISKKLTPNNKNKYICIKYKGVNEINVKNKKEI